VIARGEARRLATNPALMIGLLGLLGLLAMGVFGLMLAPHDPSAGTNLVMRDLPDGRTDIKVPPTLPDSEYWLGTDVLGRDQWSRILAGARLTLTIVLTGAVVRLAIGFTLGLLVGWYGGPVARAVRVVAAGINSIPQLVLAIMLVLVLQPLFRERGYIAAIALVGWPEIVEFLQGEVRRARAQPYMEAARSTGASALRLVRTHLVASLAPRLLTLTAIEIGAVLVLLAELGLVGLFLAGGTSLVGEFGVYMGTLKERAPEWGQMLGSIQFFAMQYQLSTLIPAIFIVLASAIFALLADGLRVASDPFGPRGVLPGTFGVVAKSLLGAVCFSAVGFFALNATPAVLTMEEGRELAAKTAQTTWPGSQFVAAVVRFSSQSHGFDRPQRVTYYFRNDRNEVLRIAYPDGDRLAAEVGLYESEDELDFTVLNPVPAGSIAWDDPIAKAEETLGSGYRYANPNWLVRGILTWPKDREGPVYEVIYGTNSRGQHAIRRACCFDAKSGESLDAIAMHRVTPPWPVPADCAVTRQVVQEVTGFPPAYFTFGQTMSVGTQQNLWFQGDNFMLILSSPSASGVTPRIERASNMTEPDAHATLQNPLALGPGPGGQTQAFGSLRLSAPGCWTVRMNAGPASLEWTLYAYPYECHAPAAQFPPPPTVTARPCVKR
jgi:ABC-type dipeptide/oligopeptide/nickel transport system permease subunit